MMKKGTIVAVNGKIYEYVGFDELIQMHKLSEIEIDENGYLTATYVVCYMANEEFALSEDGTNYFTKDQWCGIVAQFIRDGNFHLNEEEIEDATEDIVGRCFAYGIPKIHELSDYIADYMNR